ncbi:hypothetical protein TSAR_011399 [Trichomalopsis sarcophagae]|uniref:Uncharacterized protein n=1 Tax=Trichomalopsis sarcophagae TaxID=543379 RepID=A0A232ETS7_9HYME|nr:hypothetical protein TSAR_011399 [Trichomalopsis sarcophagae]
MTILETNRGKRVDKNENRKGRMVDRKG